MAAITNTTSTTIAPMESMTEIIMLLNMRLSPRMSEMYLTATRVIINPTIWRTGPADGTIPSSASIEPTPPSVFAWESEAIQEPERPIEDINVCGILSSHLAGEIEQREHPCYREQDAGQLIWLQLLSQESHRVGGREGSPHTRESGYHREGGASEGYPQVERK